MDAVTLTSLENVAKLHLDDRVGKLVAKQLAGAALKAGIATGIGKATNSTELGVIAFLAMAAINQPDLRSWLSLPAEFQVARFRLPPGNHSVTIEVAGRPTQHTVKIQPGRITLLVSRLY
jgi:hypothetical protein